MTFNNLKIFGGRYYSGMTVGTGHKWQYLNGTWTELKRDVENYDILFECQKHRIGYLNQRGEWQDTSKWPNREGTGAAVGTRYRYAILAIQEVEKISCSDYTTRMIGEKIISDYCYPHRDWATKYQEEMIETRSTKIMEAYERFCERIYPKKTSEPEQTKLMEINP